MSEGIAWQNINFTDNSDCIQLYSDPSLGLFRLLNEESLWVKFYIKKGFQTWFSEALFNILEIRSMIWWNKMF